MKNQLCLRTSLGGLAVAQLVRCICVLVLLVLTGPAVATPEGTWTALGPEGGNTVALAVASDGVVWAVTSRGDGLFRSRDGGASWQRTGENLEHFRVLAVAVDPVRPEIVYAGTAFGGIFRSTDGGSTWAPSNQGLASYSETRVKLLQVDSRTPRRVFAATDTGLYLSRDRGASWKRLLPYYVNTFAISPSDPRFVYVVASGRGFRSTDGGFTWTPIPMELGDSFFVSALVVHPTSPEIVWAGTIPRHGSRLGLFHSRDGGATWSPIWVRRKIRSLLVDPGMPDTLWAGTDGGVVRVFDQGARWRFFPVSSGEGVISLAIDRADSRILYAGTGWNDRSSDGYPGRQGGVWRSADRGRTWKQVVRGMIATEVQAVAAPAPGRIVAAVLGRGPVLGDGRVSAWSSGNQGIERDIRDLLASPANPDILWAATTNGVFRSEDGGRAWTSASEGLIPYSEFSWLHYDALAFDPSTPGGLWAAGWSGLFHSNDSGSTWARVAGLREGVPIGSVAVDPNDPRRVWAISSGGGPVASKVFRSADGGATWRETSFATQGLDGLAIGPSGTVFVAALSQLLRSTDGGETWQEVPLSVSSIAVDPAEPKNVYAGGSLGLYRSRDEGATWEPVPGDAGRSVILDLAWESPGVLLVATRGRGLLRFVPED